MKKTLFLFLIFCIGLNVICFAEEGRLPRDSFKSKNSRYEFRVVDKKTEKRNYDTEDEYEVILEETWGLFDSITNNQLYSINGIFSSYWSYISDNGKHITIVNDLLREKPNDTITVIQFFNSGKLTSKYRLGSLLCNSENYIYSEGEYEWFIDSKFSSTKSHFSLTTFEFRTLTFDIESGKLVKVKRHADFNKKSILAYGKVTTISKNQYLIEVYYSRYGIIPEDKKIKFSSKMDLGDGWRVVLLNDFKFRKYWPMLRFWEISPNIKMSSKNAGCFN